jgi:Transposase DDE domain
MKAQYRVRNWTEYNAGLKQRGSLTFWIEESVLDGWIVEDLSGKRGASVYYSDLAILTMATVKAVYHLAGRQCQGAQGVTASPKGRQDSRLETPEGQKIGWNR